MTKGNYPAPLKIVDVLKKRYPYVYVHVYIHTYTYIHTYMTYMYIHTYMHTYMHIGACALLRQLIIHIHTYYIYTCVYIYIYHIFDMVPYNMPRIHYMILYYYI
jgi:hypothetical protein